MTLHRHVRHALMIEAVFSPLMSVNAETADDSALLTATITAHDINLPEACTRCDFAVFAGFIRQR